MTVSSGVPCKFAPQSRRLALGHGAHGVSGVRSVPFASFDATRLDTSRRGGSGEHAARHGTALGTAQERSGVRSVGCGTEQRQRESGACQKLKIEYTFCAANAIVTLVLELRETDVARDTHAGRHDLRSSAHRMRCTHLESRRTSFTVRDYHE